MTFKSSALPYTQAEREADAAQARAQVDRGVKRRQACPSGQRYNIAPSKGWRKLWLRVVGETDED